MFTPVFPVFFRGARQAVLRLVVPALLTCSIAGPVWSQRTLPGCPFNLCATGVELGNAHGLTRWVDPQSGPMCAEIYTHIRLAERYLPLVNTTCAQRPSPPWPALQNWRTIQSDWESFLQQYGRARPWCPGGSNQFMIVFDHPVGGHDGMNDSQFYFKVGAWWQGLATSLRYSAVERAGVVQVQTDIADTCGGMYLTVGALLGYAQVTLQQKPASAPYAYNDAIGKYQAALTEFSHHQSPNSARGVTGCGDFSPIVNGIDRILRNGRQMGGALVQTATAIRETYLQRCQAAGASTPPQGPSYAQCLNKYCPECAQSISLMGVSAGANCEACKSRNARLISDCARGSQTGSSTPPGGGTGAVSGGTPSSGGSLSLDISDWQRAPGYAAGAGNAQGVLVMQGGRFTNGRAVNGIYDGNRLQSKAVIDLSAGGDVYAAFAADGAGQYLVFWPRLHTGAAIPAFTTHHSFANSVLVPQGTPLFGHLRADRGGRYLFTVSLRAYGDRGGQIIHRSSGVLSNPVGRMDFQFGDNYAGDRARLIVREVLVQRGGM